jgi:hypothetical protein
MRGVKMSRAVVLLSAGLDSVVSFKLAYDAYDSIKCLTFDYGQKARVKEIEFASKICAAYRVSHHIIELPWYASFEGALTDDNELPQLTKETYVKLQKPYGCLPEMRFFFQLRLHFAKIIIMKPLSSDSTKRRLPRSRITLQIS